MKKVYSLIAAALVAASAQAQYTNDDPITDVQGGTVVTGQVREDISLSDGWSGISRTVNTNFVGQYVVTDTAIYLARPVSSRMTYRDDSYVSHNITAYLKLSKVNDSIYVAHTPQPFYSYSVDGSEKRFYLTHLVLNADEGNYGLDTNDGVTNYDITFKYKDGVLSQNDASTTTIGNYSFPNDIVGVTDDQGVFQNYGSGLINIHPVQEPIYRPAEGDNVADYIFSYKVLNDETGEESTTSTVRQAAFSADNKYVYLRDPYTNTDNWIRGEISEDGKTAVFLKQYLKADFTNNRHLWAQPVKDSIAFEQGFFGDSYYYDFTAADSLVFNVDLTAHTLTAVPGNTLIILPDGKSLSYAVDQFPDPSYAPYNSVGAATPAEPSFATEDPIYKYNGYTYVRFYVPTETANGDYLDPSDLTFNMYILYEGESKETATPFVFDNTTYQRLDSTITTVPVEFTDNYDFYYDRVRGGLHTVCIYGDTSEMSWIGVKSNYTLNGVTNSTDIAWLNVPQTLGIQGVQDNAKTVKDIKSFDASGRQVSANTKGLILNRVTYTDGTTQTFKQINR